MNPILSFLELDDSIQKILLNQNEILNNLTNLQNNQNLIDKEIDINKSLDFNIKNIIYFAIGTILVVGIIYYFTSDGGGGNNDSINLLFNNLNSEILNKINLNNQIVDNNLKYMLDTIRRNDDHLIDVLIKVFTQNQEKIQTILNLRVFNAILKNGRHLDDITKILENSNLVPNIENITTSTFKKVVFSDES